MHTAAAKPVQQTLLFRPSVIVEPIALERIFLESRPLEVELGSGDGTFLVEYARQHFDHNFLGVERLLGRIRKLDRKGRRAGLTNLRGIRIEAAYFLEYLLPPNSTTTIHVYFPDPWPKRKHRVRRLINERFTNLAYLALQRGGMVYLRTDDQDYFEQMVSAFVANPGFRPVNTPPELAAALTDFERDFQARGVATLRVAYQRD